MLISRRSNFFMYNAGPLLHDFSRHIPRQPPIVYRIIDAALMDIFFNIPT